MTGACAVAGGSDLGWYQHGYYAPWLGQLEGSLQKGDGQVGRLAVAATAASRPAVPGSDLSPSVERDCFRAEPGWIADYQIEAALGKNVGERAGIVKPGDFVMAGQVLTSLPETADSGALLIQAGAQLPIQSSLPAEQIRSPGELKVACDDATMLLLSLPEGAPERSSFEPA